jgi:hypothetical protein
MKMAQKNTVYPKIHLSLDNCFAIKRWVRPRDWMNIIKQIEGITNIQASTDNEIDPLFNTHAYRGEWVREVEEYEKLLGLKVVSLYSGYATYRTTGLGHWDEACRNTLINRYYKPVVNIAKKLGAQVGNALSAFSAPILNDPVEYRKADKILIEKLISMTQYAQKKGVLFSYEQMYTPIQGFWTIDGCLNYIRTIYRTCNYPMYITIDTAHQVGQKFFIPPNDQQVEAMLFSGEVGEFRLGERIPKMISEGRRDSTEIRKALELQSYLYSRAQDCDVYTWFSKLGCYSPLVHLQQTDGTYSGHKPFTEEFNAKGIIDPMTVLKAIARSYETDDNPDMPPKVKDIYLTFELFFGITETNDRICNDLSESIAFWRRSIPKDGMALNDLIYL